MKKSNSNSNSQAVLEVNPFLQDVIVRKLIGYLDFETLVKTRLLCKLWNETTYNAFISKSLVKFQIPSHELVEEWTVDYELDNKSQHFQFYLHCFKEDKLPHQPREEIPFQNFKFLNYRNIQRHHRCWHGHPTISVQNSNEGSGLYPHTQILKALDRDFNSFVQSLAFLDEPRQSQNRNVNHNEVGAANLIQGSSYNYQAEFIYPDWFDCLQNFGNLQALELIGMRRSQTEKCLTDLHTLLESGYSSFKIRKLVICPGSFLEFDLTREDHTNYIKLLTSVLSLLPIEDFTLKSHLSAEELPVILKTVSRTLQNLSLHRMPLIPSQIQMFQNTESSIFPLDLPSLTSLIIPNVYFYNMEEINRNLPRLTALKLKYQPMMICTEFSHNNNQNPDQLEGNEGDFNVIADCAAVRLDFSLVDETPLTNENLKSIQWSVDPSAQVLNNFQIDVSEVCDMSLFGISRVFPNLRELICYISSQSDLEMLWERYSHVESIVISGDSPYKTKNEDIIGGRGNDHHSGILSMKRLRTIKFLNDNSNLTEDCFTFGFLQLPWLRSVEIRRAPRLVELELPSLKSFVEAKPNLLAVQIFKD